MEPYLVKIFPVWSAGMVLEEFDLLEKTTHEEKQNSNRYNGNGVETIYFLDINKLKAFTVSSLLFTNAPGLKESK